jgi:hypothetical protein
MSYNHSQEPGASLGGLIVILFFIVAATTAIFSTGLAGPADRRVTVVLPASDHVEGP